MATHSSILAWKIPWIRGLASYSPWGHRELDMTEQMSTVLSFVSRKHVLRIFIFSTSGYLTCLINVS